MDPKDVIAILSKENFEDEKLKFLNQVDSLEMEDAKSGGNVNKIYRIKSKDGKHSIVMKYGDETILHIESLKDWRLPIERRELEYESLKMFHSIYPGSVPQPYYFNKQLHLILMEDLGYMDILGSRIRDGIFDIKHAQEIGKIFATVQKKTHKKIVSPETWKEYQHKFTNAAGMDFLINVRFNWLLEGGRIPDIPASMQEQYDGWIGELNTDNLYEKIKLISRKEDCLVHLDSHWDAMFVSDTRIAMFDIEWGGLGNQAFSLGFLMGCYILSLAIAGEKYENKMEQIKTQSKECCQELYSSFMTTFGDDHNLLEPLSTFISEMAAICGQLIFSSSYAVLLKVNNENRAKLAAIGMELMRDHQTINTIDKLINSMFSL